MARYFVVWYVDGWVNGLPQGVGIMPIGPFETYKIESNTEADHYLKELFKIPKYRSMDEVLIRSHDVKGDELRKYFIEKGRKMLREFVSD